MSENKSVAVAQPQKATIRERLGKTTLVTGVAGAVTALSATANAALDTSSLEADIASNGTAMQTVMLAVLTLIALFVGYRMIKRSMS